MRPSARVCVSLCPAFSVAAMTAPLTLSGSAPLPASCGRPEASTSKTASRPAFGNCLAPQLGFAPRRSGMIQIWKIFVVSGSRLYSECTTPVPADMTCTSPASVRPRLRRLSSWLIAPRRT